MSAGLKACSWSEEKVTHLQDAIKHHMQDVKSGHGGLTRRSTAVDGSEEETEKCFF